MESASPSTPADPASTATPTLSPREQTKLEFYRSYDVMTGVRIAATLGGFFGLMVILVVYKSKSKTEKVLTNPQLAAAVVEAEEERHQLSVALEAAAEYRRSLGNTSAPIVAATSRFSSRSASLWPCAGPVRLLDTRRPSYATATFSSSDMSCYLERRTQPHIDIRVTQPTPGGSPQMPHRRLAPLASISSCASSWGAPPMQKPTASLAVDYPDMDARSFGSDSVFLDDDECFDTDDEVTQFSTDSDSDTVTVTGTGVGALPLKDRPSVSGTPGRARSSSCSQETLF